MRINKLTTLFLALTGKLSDDFVRFLGMLASTMLVFLSHHPRTLPFNHPTLLLRTWALRSRVHGYRLGPLPRACNLVRFVCLYSSLRTRQFGRWPASPCFLEQAKALYLNRLPMPTTSFFTENRGCFLHVVCLCARVLSPCACSVLVHVLCPCARALSVHCFLLYAFWFFHPLNTLFPDNHIT